MEVVIKLSQAQQRFLEENALPLSYLAHAQHWFSPIAEQIAAHQNNTNLPFLLGINGCQGSGKSTLASYLAMVLSSEYHLSCAILSLDDFYLSQVQRQQLSQSVHPLLATRGVPGTHDTHLMKQILNALKAGQPTRLPRFNKATDDPVARDLWPQITGAVDIILMEGWCWGTPAQAIEELAKPVNTLEQEHDPEGSWRTYVNQQLQSNYLPLFELADFSLMLKAPSFDCVMQWRLEQEQKLAQALSEDDDASGVMSEQQIMDFISYFQRLTSHSLARQPALTDVIWQLDSTRGISSMEQHRKPQA